MRVFEFIALPSPLRARYLRSKLFSLIPASQKIWDNKILKQSEILLEGLKSSHVEGSSYLVCVPDIRCGIGHILAEWNAGYTLANLLNAEFVSLPIPQYWDELLDFNAIALSFRNSKWKFRSIKRMYLPYIAFSTGPNEWDAYSAKLYKRINSEQLVYVLYDGQNLFDHSSSREYLRNRMWNSKLMKVFREVSKEEAIKMGGLKQLAVHIRRGDIVANPRWSNRIVPTSWYKEQIENICSSSNSKWCVNVFTQNLKEDLNEELAGDWKLRIFNNHDARESFARISLADAIVGSKSGFSYFSALYSRSHRSIFPRNFWHDTSAL